MVPAEKNTVLRNMEEHNVYSTVVWVRVKIEAAVLIPEVIKNSNQHSLDCFFHSAFRIISHSRIKVIPASFRVL